MAKGRGCEIVRASWNSSENIPMENRNWIMHVHGHSNVVLKDKRDGTVNQKLFHYHTTHATGPFYIRNYKKSIVVRLWYVIVSWFGVRPCSSRWVGRIHSMSCRTPCRYILSIQASTTLWASSSSVKWSGTVPIFSNNERTQISMVPGHFYSSVKSAALSWKRALRNLQWGEFI